MQRLLSRSNVKQWLEKWDARFQSLQTREKGMVVAGGIAVLGFILYAGFFAPLLDANAELREKIPTLQKQLSALEAFDHDLKGGSGPSDTAVKISSPVELLTQLQKGLMTSGLYSDSARIKQVRGDAMSVHLAAVSFDKMMSWLIETQKTQAIHIGDLSVRANATPGNVDADLILTF